MCAETLECPREVGLGGDAKRATGGNDAEQNACTVSAFGAAGKEHVEPEFGDILKVTLSWRVIDRDQRIVDEAEERLAVIDVVVDRRRQRLGR